MVLAIGVLTAAGFGTAAADAPGRHPYYLHALTDLRGARWLLEHRPGEANVKRHEDAAIREIDAAIREITIAAIEDGKDIGDHGPMDSPGGRPGRLHQTADLLRKVQGDVSREEDDPAAVGLKQRALLHIDAAYHETVAAIADVEQEHP